MKQHPQTIYLYKSADWDKIREKLSELSHDYFAGPDSIHSFTLKATATEISSMLAHIFLQSLETGSVPSDWKHAYVTPIFKKGTKSDPRNYCPISLTSVVCKMMEHILVKQ